MVHPRHVAIRGKALAALISNVPETLRFAGITGKLSVKYGPEAGCYFRV